MKAEDECKGFGKLTAHVFDMHGLFKPEILSPYWKLIP